MSERIESNKTTRLVFAALMSALVLLGTMILRVPIPMTQGYVHLGDSMIFLGVLMIGKKYGALSAGVGSALADILGGYPFWAPWTFIIKAVMAFTAGLIIERALADTKSNKASLIINIVGMAVGGLIMTLGYFIAETLMYGSAGAAALGIPWNIGQAAVGIVISLILGTALSEFRSAR